MKVECYTTEKAIKVEYYTTEKASTDGINFIEQTNFGGQAFGYQAHVESCFYLTNTRSDPSRWTVALWKIKYKTHARP